MQYNFFKNLKLNEEETAEVGEYAYTDIDSDGDNELVILTTAYSGEFLILHYNTIIYILRQEKR